MRILLLGATGRTGRLVPNHAFAHGHEVAALVRSAARLKAAPGLAVLQGSPSRLADVRRAIAGCQAVIATLNNNRASDWPWARPVDPPDFMTRAVANTLSAMAEEGVRRIVVLSSLGVGDSFARASVVMRWLIRHSALGQAFRDHDGVDGLLRASDTDWTEVRPVNFAGGAERRIAVTTDPDARPRGTIRREEVARFLVDCLTDPAAVRTAPVLSSH